TVPTSPNRELDRQAVKQGVHWLGSQCSVPPDVATRAKDQNRTLPSQFRTDDRQRGRQPTATGCPTIHSTFSAAHRKLQIPLQNSNGCQRGKRTILVVSLGSS